MSGGFDTKGKDQSFHTLCCNYDIIFFYESWLVNKYECVLDGFKSFVIPS